jgi:acid stress chaperone HdeB
MRFILIMSGLVLGVVSISPAQAQITIDASKITCDQFVHSKVGSPRVIAAWLSGFYNGKRDNQVLDVQNFEGNLGKLEQFCYQEKNFKLPVMQAVEELFGAGNK